MIQKYKLSITLEADKDIQKHKKSGNKALIKKLAKILEELQEHPETGTGKPEKLKHGLSGFWSRRLNLEHRIVYEIQDNIVTVTVVSAMGHYNNN